MESNRNQAEALAWALVSPDRRGNDRVITIAIIDKIENALDAAFMRGVEASVKLVDELRLTSTETGLTFRPASADMFVAALRALASTSKGG